MQQSDVEALKALHKMSGLDDETAEPEYGNRKARRAAKARKRKADKKKFTRSNMTRK